MSKKTASELISQFSSIVGEDTTPEVVAMMEDIKDSVEPDPFEEKYNQKVAEYDELLTKYRERFESGSDVEDKNETIVESEEVHDKIEDITFEDLLVDD